MLASVLDAQWSSSRLATIAQAPAPSAPVNPSPNNSNSASSLWMFGTLGAVVALIALSIYLKITTEKLNKQIRVEQFRSHELKKRLDLALKTMRKMETNPDLVDSRDFNLDYLRMRMEEETFHYIIVNQIKMKVKLLVSVALRPQQQQAGVTNAHHNGQHGRQIDHTFDVEQDPATLGKGQHKRVLFRIQVRLTKLPTQATSKTIEEIINCLERYLSLTEDTDDNWQPTLQGRLASISWDQKAKPTPLLVLEQASDGNVTLRKPRSLRANPA